MGVHKHRKNPPQDRRRTRDGAHEGALRLGKFKVNDKIPTEQELANLFGKARDSIREAISHTPRSFMHEEIEKTCMDADIQRSFHEHQEFVELIEAGEGDKVVDAPSRHIQSIADKLRESLTK